MATARTFAESEPALGLRVEGVSHAYGARRVIEEVNLAVVGGEVHCLVGPSGCGKTTMLRLIAGLEPLQGGRISIDGGLVAEPHDNLLPEQRRVGLMFQDFALFPHLRVVDNVAFGLRDLNSRQRRQRAQELLAQVNMSDHADSYPHMLSGGEQQRVALARAALGEPAVIIADEPTAELDLNTTRAVCDLLRGLAREREIAVVVSTHDPEVMQTADHVLLLRDGAVQSETFEGRERTVIDATGRLQLPPEVLAWYPNRRVVLEFDPATNTIVIRPA